MNLGEATAVFKNINQGGRTVEEKKSAIRTVLGMETHNGITKQEFINALEWLLDHPNTFDVDKVVERLEERYLMCICKNNDSCDYPEKIGCCYDRAINDCVEIVRAEFEQCEKPESEG